MKETGRNGTRERPIEMIQVPSNRMMSFEEFLAGGQLHPSLQVDGLPRIVDWLRLGIYLSAPVLTLNFAASLQHGAVMLTAGVVAVIPAVVRLVKRRHEPANLAITTDLILVTLMAAVLNATFLGAFLAILALFAVTMMEYDSDRRWLVTLTALAAPWAYLIWYLRDSFIPDAGIPLGISGPLLGAYVVTTGLTLVLFRSKNRTPVQAAIHLSNALDVAPLAVAVLDRKGHVVERAGDGTVLPGLAVGVSIEDAIPKYQALELIGKAMRGERSDAVIHLERHTVRVKMSAIERNGTITAFSVSAFDITEQEDARKRLVATVEAKDEFLASVSHELRTPLTSVVGFAEAALEGIDDMPLSELGELLGIISSEAKDAAYMIEDLLVAARAENKTIAIRPEVVALTQLVEATLNGLPQISATNEVEDLHCIADPHRLKQVVRNLLTNASRYGGDTITVATSRAGGRVMIHVRDSGAEIEPEMQKSMFEPFVRNKKEGGHSNSIGLGLTVSSQLVALMGGTLTYAHRDGWSEFSVNLAEPTPDPFAAEVLHTSTAAR